MVYITFGNTKLSTAFKQNEDKDIRFNQRGCKQAGELILLIFQCLFTSPSSNCYIRSSYRSNCLDRRKRKVSSPDKWVVDEHSRNDKQYHTIS